MPPPPQIPTSFVGPVQVIAAGLPRCATTTIKEICEKPQYLDVGPTMHMNRCMLAPANMTLVYNALKEKDTQKRRAILYKLFAGCAATADFPGHLFLEDLVEMYPDAKIVLNIRKGDSGKQWAESMATTIAPFMSWKYRVAGYLSTPDYLHYQCEIEWERFTRERFGSKHYYDEDVYDAHNAWVKQVCKEKGRELLIWEPSQGWGPLCKFLGKKEPDQPIPRTNDRVKMEKIVGWRIGVGLSMWAAKVGVPLVASLLSGWGLSRFMEVKLLV
jgi:hypothetical protein